MTGERELENPVRELLIREEEAVAVVVGDLGPDEQADDVVVAEVLPAFDHDVVQQHREFHHGRGSVFADGAAVVAREEPVGEVVYLLALVFGDAEELSDHRERELDRELLDDVESRLVAEAIEKLAAVLAHDTARGR